VLDLGCGWARMVSGLPVEAQLVLVFYYSSITMMHGPINIRHTLASVTLSDTS